MIPAEYVPNHYPEMCFLWSTFRGQCLHLLARVLDLKFAEKIDFWLVTAKKLHTVVKECIEFGRFGMTMSREAQKAIKNALFG